VIFGESKSNLKGRGTRQPGCSKHGRVAHPLVLLDTTRTEGGPLLRFVQGWEPRTDTCGSRRCKSTPVASTRPAQISPLSAASYPPSLNVFVVPALATNARAGHHSHCTAGQVKGWATHLRHSTLVPLKTSRSACITLSGNPLPDTAPNQTSS